jgi:large subunit ribosomal protein L22
MEAKAIAKHVRISPTKIRVILDMIRGKDVNEALNMLSATVRRITARAVEKVVKSALANAAGSSIDADNLYIGIATADAGATLKRMRPRAMGRANQILKKSSHITIILKEKKDSGTKN